MLNIPEWNQINEKNKKWHQKNRKFDLGSMVKKIEEMDDVMEKMRVVLYGVVKLTISDIVPT
jgi:hypothetical protein